MREAITIFAMGLLFAMPGADSVRPGKSLAQNRFSALSGCFHEGRYYYERSLIPTVDSCINCKCEAGLVRCNMTLCPMYPSIQEGCHLAHEEGLCCPQLTCDENVAKKLANVPIIHEATLVGCTYNDVEFGLGDFIPTSDPCQACYCIHNRTQCVHQNCALPESAREGCRPVYHQGMCCPIRYDCSEALSAPPTQNPPYAIEGCSLHSRLYDEGEAIPSGRPCEHCYCMKGEMICAMQKCDSPMAGCTPVIKEGQCCPERYECPNADSNAVGTGGLGKNQLLAVNVSLHGMWNGDKLSATTRGLDDELGDTQQTTGSSVVVTSPMSRATDGPGLPRSRPNNLPTVLPTQAQLGFNDSVFNASTWRKPAADTNQSSSAVSENQVGNIFTTSSPWDVADASHSRNGLPANLSAEDLLAHSVLTTKVGFVPPVTSSEILNSGETLGSRGPMPTTQPSTGGSQISITSGIGGQRVQVNQSKNGSGVSVGSSSSLSSSAQMGDGNMAVPGPTTKLVTHMIDGNNTLEIITSSSDENEISLNTRINVTAPSPTANSSKDIRASNFAGIASSTDNPQRSATPPGSRARAPVIPAPLDPTASDPIEGLIRYFHSGDNQASAASPPGQSGGSSLSPLDETNQITGGNHRTTGEKMTVQVPYSHLTEVGIARPTVVDPLTSDDIEGQLREASNRLASMNLNRTAEPVDPSSASQVEGVVNTLDVTTSSAKPVDPSLASGIEEPLTPEDTIQHVTPGLPVDPTSGMQLEGVLTVGDTSTRLGSVANSLKPVDPQQPSEVEGALGLSNSPANLTLISGKHGPAPVVPIDPSASEAEGVTGGKDVRKGTLSKVSVGISSFVPVDPATGDQIEGVSNAIVNIRKGGITGQPVDPSSSDRITGIAVIPARKPELKAHTNLPRPLEPSNGDIVEGLWTLPNPVDVENSQISAGTSNSSRVASASQTVTEAPVPVPTSAGPFIIAGALISRKQTITGLKSTTTAPALTGQPLITIRVNGSVPAPLMLALNNAKTTDQIDLLQATPSPRPSNPSGWGPRSGWGSSVADNQISGNRKIKPPGVPVEPQNGDAFEGLLKTILPFSTTVPPRQEATSQKPMIRRPLNPLDPQATDDFEGLNHANWDQPVYASAVSQNPGSGLPNVVIEPSTSTVTSTTVRATSINLPARFSTKASQAADRIGGLKQTTTTVLPSSTTVAPSTTLLATSTSNAQSSNLMVSHNGMASTSTDVPRPTTGSEATDVSTALLDTSSAAGLLSGTPEGSMFNGTLAVVANGAPLTGVYENGCYFNGNYYRNYQAISTNDLVDPCLVRLCKDGVIFGPSQQRCPPPIQGCFSTSIPGVCCPVYLCPNYLERNETSYTLTAAAGDQLNTEKTRLALAKFCRVGPRFLALNERVVHVMGVQCQTCTCKQKGIVCEPGCAQNLLITTIAPEVHTPRRFETVPTSPPSTTTSTLPAVTEPNGSRSCVIQKKRFHHGDEVTFNDPCHICTCLDGLVICKMNRKACRSAKLLGALEPYL